MPSFSFARLNIIPAFALMIAAALPSAFAGDPIPPTPTATPEATATPTPAGTVVAITPSADNSLYEDPAGGLSNGIGNYIFTGLAGTSIRRALLKFDVAGSVPPGMEILSAELRLNMSRTISGPSDASIHEVFEDWGEGASQAFGQEGGGAPAEPGDVTWIHTFHATDFWTTPGGDFDPAASAVTSVDGNGFYTWGTTSAMVADVQAWLDTPAQNFGWILVGDEVALFSAKRFDSRENFEPMNRPVLTIVYDVAPPSATATPSPAASPTSVASATPTAPPCCPGDANNSGSFVDANDFIAVQANFGADNGVGGLGDANCSGSFVDANDFIAVQANFGADCG